MIEKLIYATDISGQRKGEYHAINLLIAFNTGIQSIL